MNWLNCLEKILQIHVKLCLIHMQREALSKKEFYLKIDILNDYHFSKLAQRPATQVVLLASGSECHFIFALCIMFMQIRIISIHTGRRAKGSRIAGVWASWQKFAMISFHTGRRAKGTRVAALLGEYALINLIFKYLPCFSSSKSLNKSPPSVLKPEFVSESIRKG